MDHKVLGAVATIARHPVRDRPPFISRASRLLLFDWRALAKQAGAFSPSLDSPASSVLQYRRNVCVWFFGASLVVGEKVVFLPW